MAKTYLELLAERKTLDEQIEQVRTEARASALATIHQLMNDFEISPAELGAKRSTKKSSPVAAKYRDPASGKTWSGRGKPPAWIAGQDRAAFAI
ncbi:MULTISPECIES: H-NS histone family protein [Burkholderia cepacia complex]|uniref:Histone n=1 Tax=Burkholderia contaminans TaxID=488447 RepID=A0A2S5DMC5_9BURK|nr:MULTISPECIES: H-NS histone family protein [Burkholderia cepacia complex]KVR89511.1 histone [Burkholderia vietnamiensis]MBR7920234.1 H-NS histone family protein [Burkholderia vietnamiensis]MBR8205322.1 H-NS histone family protein [Burkholderia vietnamiensis]POZ80235.1 histone [Burkholderia contaminans]HDR9133244.1 H-NS histone family protein [Burkholderia vietnamiensis]